MISMRAPLGKDVRTARGSWGSVLSERFSGLQTQENGVGREKGEQRWHHKIVQGHSSRSLEMIIILILFFQFNGILFVTLVLLPNPHQTPSDFEHNQNEDG
jgi:hypothetical protein